MNNEYIKQIKERILSLEDRTSFTTSDFIGIANSMTVRLNLNQTVQAVILHCIFVGVVKEPKYRSIFNEFVKVNTDIVTKSLAHTYQKPIIPYDNPALYL